MTTDELIGILRGEIVDRFEIDSTHLPKEVLRQLINIQAASEKYDISQKSKLLPDLQSQMSIVKAEHSKSLILTQELSRLMCELKALSPQKRNEVLKSISDEHSLKIMIKEEVPEAK